MRGVKVWKPLFGDASNLFIFKTWTNRFDFIFYMLTSKEILVDLFIYYFLFFGRCSSLGHNHLIWTFPAKLKKHSLIVQLFSASHTACVPSSTSQRLFLDQANDIHVSVSCCTPDACAHSERNTRGNSEPEMRRLHLLVGVTLPLVGVENKVP